VSNVYDQGDLIRLSAAFTVDGVAANPTIIRCKVRTPGGVVTTSVYGTDAALVRDSTGVYHLDLSVTTSGTYTYRWEGTGAAQAAEETTLLVRRSAF